MKTKPTDYEYIIATDANRLRLEVYARDPVAFFQKYNEKVLQFCAKNGFGGGSFWNAPQPIYQGPDCQWPNEKEVFARRSVLSLMRDQNDCSVLRNQQQKAQSPAGAGGAGSAAGGVFGGVLNPQAALSTLQSFFGQRPGQQQPSLSTFGQALAPPAQPAQPQLNFGDPTDGSIFANPDNVQTQQFNTVGGGRAFVQ